MQPQLTGHMAGLGLSHAAPPHICGTAPWAIGQLSLGTLSLRIAQTPQDFATVHSLRGQRFHRDAPEQPDEDGFDPLCLHLMVEPAGGGALLATARLRLLTCAAEFDNSYTALSYGLAPVGQHYPRALEIGRLCLLVGAEPAAEILRALFAGITALGLQTRANVLIGCASLLGADASRHFAALAYLRDHHLGPQDCRPLPRALQTVAFDAIPAEIDGNARQLPPLLRMYLAMGGWVSDFAVIDPALDNVHVLVAVPVAAIPPARLRALGALLGAAPLSLD